MNNEDRITECLFMLVHNDEYLEREIRKSRRSSNLKIFLLFLLGLGYALRNEYREIVKADEMEDYYKDKNKKKEEVEVIDNK